MSRFLGKKKAKNKKQKSNIQHSAAQMWNKNPLQDVMAQKTTQILQKLKSVRKR